MIWKSRREREEYVLSRASVALYTVHVYAMETFMAH
jgi:hypothetical protein